MQFRPATVLKIEYISALHPDVIPNPWIWGWQRIRIGRADVDGVSLRDISNADRLDDEITKLDSLIGRSQEVGIRSVECQEDMEIAVGFLADGFDDPRNVNTAGLHVESVRVVDVLVLVGLPARARLRRLRLRLRGGF